MPRPVPARNAAAAVPRSPLDAGAPPGGAELPVWDLGDLYRSPEDPALGSDLQAATADARDLTATLLRLGVPSDQVRALYDGDASLPGVLSARLGGPVVAVLVAFLAFDVVGSARGWFASSPRGQPVGTSELVVDEQGGEPLRDRLAHRRPACVRVLDTW